MICLQVQAQPMPFQGVHKQDKIIDSGIQQVANRLNLFDFMFQITVKFK